MFNFPIRIVERYYRRSDLEIIRYVQIEETVYTYPVLNLFRRVSTWRSLPQEFNSWQSAYEFAQRAIKVPIVPVDNVVKVINDPSSFVELSRSSGGD